MDVMPRSRLGPREEGRLRLRPRIRGALITLAMLVPSLLPPAYAGRGFVDPGNGGIEFDVHFRFPPTPGQLADVKAALDRMAIGVCDATDGQMRVSKIVLTQGQASEKAADFWLHAKPGRSGVSFDARKTNFGVDGAHVDMFSEALTRSDVYLHEFGHHAFGLGDQYDEQQHLGGHCGTGPGFQPGAADERNHSIMQQLGGAPQCVGGPSAGSGCLRPSDCPGGACELVMMSELSTASNHDPLRGSDVACPAPVALSRVDVSGRLRKLDPIATFDATTFDTAEATSSVREEVELIDALGTEVGRKLRLYFTRTGASQWLVSALVDAAVVGGTAGTPHVLGQWPLTFDAPGALTSVGAGPLLPIAPLANGAPPLTVSVDFGASGPAPPGGDVRESAFLPSSIRLATNGQRPLCPDDDYCRWTWNKGSERYEGTQQTAMHEGDSDWTTVAKRYSFVIQPMGAPEQDPSLRCYVPVSYVENVAGSDQVLLLLDRSGSMSWSSDKATAEVCANAADDDGDGSVDEAPCADPRIAFVRQAAKAYLDLQVHENIDVGILSFNDTNAVDAGIAALTPASLAALKGVVDGLVPTGDTAIGDALRASLPEFARVSAAGRSQTAYLMTDGINNRGSAPDSAADALRSANILVHVIPAGTDVDETELTNIASTTGGTLYPAVGVNDLAAVYAELAAHHGGAALAVPRVRFDLDATGGSARVENPLAATVLRERPRELGLPIVVERNAQSLVAFVAGRNARMAEWSVEIELRGPNGERVGPGSPELTATSHYRFLDVRAPAPGRWMLWTRATGAAVQNVTALAFIRNPQPDFFVDVSPRIARGGGTVRLLASPVFESALAPVDVVVQAYLTAPDDTTSTLNVRRGAGGLYEADTPALTLNGRYRIDATASVGPAARPAGGESIFPGPGTPSIDVVPFVRFATTSFFLVEGRAYGCEGTNARDCDADTIADASECPRMKPDIDGDGRPNDRDPDADGDGVPAGCSLQQHRRTAHTTAHVKRARAAAPIRAVHSAGIPDGAARSGSRRTPP